MGGRDGNVLHDHCARCSYSLRGLDGYVCPECGLRNDPDSVYAYRCKRTRRHVIWLGAGLAVLASSCCIGLSFTGFGPNFGFLRGYYGDLNAVKARVASINGVRIERVRANYDLSIEDFSLDVIIDDAHRTSIYFPDTNLRARLRIIRQWEMNELPKFRTTKPE